MITHETYPAGSEEPSHVVRWILDSGWLSYIEAWIWPAARLSDGTVEALEDGCAVLPETAELPEIKLEVKRDGCANLDTAPSGCLFHVCSGADLADLGALLAWVHGRALDLLEARGVEVLR